MRTLSLTLICAALAASLFFKSYDYMEDVFTAEDTLLSQAQRDAILQGADPSDILEQTAAGDSSDDRDNACRFGKIVGQQQAEKLHGSFYVALREGNATYIQVSPLLPVYLKQAPHQSTSASLFTPDQAVKTTLSQLFEQRERCITSDLYLQTLKSTHS